MAGRFHDVQLKSGGKERKSRCTNDAAMNNMMANKNLFDFPSSAVPVP
jgi:hypothetical protein